MAELTDKKKRSLWQLRIFLLCWFAYALIYFGRVNLSIAVPQLEQHFSSNKATIGMLGSMFFWFYAIGQLISCTVNDKLNSKLFIFISIFAAGICNLLFSFANSLKILMFLWALNSIVQSILWGNIVKIAVQWFSPKQYTKVMVGLNTSMVLGYIMGWGGCGLILKYSSWRGVFFVPGIVLIAFSALWLILSKEKPIDVGVSIDNMEDYPEKIEIGRIQTLNYKQLFLGSGLLLVVLACIAQSMVKEGIGVWAPSMLTQIYNVDMSSATSYVLFIPIMNLIGILASGAINKKLNGKDEATTIILFAVAIISLLIFGWFGMNSFGLGVMLLGICSAVMYGVNTMLLGTLPIKYAKYGKAAFVTGFLNFCSYLGAGISTTLVGGLLDIGLGYSAIFIFWAVITTIATIALIIKLRLKKDF